MKLFLLRPVKDLPNENPWEPWYDKTFGFVVRAENHVTARHLADEAGGDETSFRSDGSDHPWLDPKFSTCVELLKDGGAEVVINDHHSA